MSILSGFDVIEVIWAPRIPQSEDGGIRDSKLRRTTVERNDRSTVGRLKDQLKRVENVTHIYPT